MTSGSGILSNGRGQSGGSEPYRAGTPAGDPEAATPRRQTRGAAPVSPRLITHLRVQALRRASARWRNQAAGPAGRRSRGPVYPVANGPAVSASIAESVLLLASAPDRL